MSYETTLNNLVNVLILAKLSSSNKKFNKANFNKAKTYVLAHLKARNKFITNKDEIASFLKGEFFGLLDRL